MCVCGRGGGGGGQGRAGGARAMEKRRGVPKVCIKYPSS